VLSRTGFRAGLDVCFFSPEAGWLAGPGGNLAASSAGGACEQRCTLDDVEGVVGRLSLPPMPHTLVFPSLAGPTAPTLAGA